MRTPGRRSWRAALAVGLLTATVPAPAASAEITVGPASVIGRWGAPFEEGGPTAPACVESDGRAVCKPVAQALGVLPDGRLLYFDGSSGGEGEARLLDLRSGGPVWSTPGGTDPGLLGADAASLGDGRLLVAGGAGRRTRLYDPATDRFTPAGPMRLGRRYPVAVTLPDGRVMVAGGAPQEAGGAPDQAAGAGARHVGPTEIFNPATGAWADAGSGPGSEAALPLSPHLHLMPNGKVLYTAVGESAFPAAADATADEALYPLLRFFDPDRGRWDVVGADTLGVRDGAGTVLLALDPPYDHATVLTFGGALGPPPSSAVGTSLVTETDVDRSGHLKERKTRWEMRGGRWNPSGVVLPDGAVLAVGGAGTSETAAPEAGLPARTAELFDPTTEQWSPMAAANRDHTYGQSAVLLPDGRVLLGGHAPPAAPGPEPAAPAPGAPEPALGEGLPQRARDASFEIFSPYYLFRGPRPTIRHAPAGVAWGTAFEVATHQALSIESVVLSRLSSPAHSADSDARTLRLGFRRRSNALRVSAPPDGAVAPPGWYYLFVNREGPHGPVPSMARIVHVGASGDPGEAAQPFPDDHGPLTNR